MQQKYQVFLAVVEEKNFSRAAEKLFITQPAVSQYIRTLEKEMGTVLFDRGGKTVTLTRAGEIVLVHVQEMNRIYESMHRTLDEYVHQPKGVLKIGASYTFGEHVLPKIMASFLKRYPAIEPSVTIGNTQEICTKISARMLDIGLIEGDRVQKDLQVMTVGVDKMYIVAKRNHPLYARDGLRFSDLEQATWLIRERGSGTREAAEKMFAQLQIKPQKKIEFGSTHIIKESVEAGLGIALLSEWAVKKELKHGSLTIIPCEEMPFTRKFSIIRAPSQFEAKTCEVFRETVIEFLKDV